MTKPRSPLSFGQAITRIAGLIGWDAAAGIVDRSQRLIRRWSEDDQSATPSLTQALALDAAWCAAGGEGAPIRDAYSAQLDLRVEAETACHLALAESIATASRECGEALSRAIALVIPGASATEVYRAIGEAKEAADALAAMLRHVNSFLPAGAGPGAGIEGGTQ